MSAPVTSVLSPCRLPSGSSSTVLQAPVAPTHSSYEPSSGTASRLSGMVSDSPRHVVGSSPSRNPASPPDGTCTASYCQPSSPSAA